LYALAVIVWAVVRGRQRIYGLGTRVSPLALFQCIKIKLLHSRVLWLDDAKPAGTRSDFGICLTPYNRPLIRMRNGDAKSSEQRSLLTNHKGRNDTPIRRVDSRSEPTSKSAGYTETSGSGSAIRIHSNTRHRSLSTHRRGGTTSARSRLKYGLPIGTETKV
jgi:hypothetical protein